MRSYKALAVLCAAYCATTFANSLSAQSDKDAGATIAAAANDSDPRAGVACNVRLMACKCLNANRSSSSYAYLNLLWGIRNTGQTISGQEGVAGADLSARAVWNTAAGGTTIVPAGIDTAAAENWRNSGLTFRGQPGPLRAARDVSCGVVFRA